MIKDFDSGNNMNGIDSASTRVGKDCDENMFFDIEGTRVQGELQACSFEEGTLGDSCSHELTQWHHRDLGGDGCYGERLCAIPEELVQER